MNDIHPLVQCADFGTICAEHTRRVQVLAGEFWKGDINLWVYRKLSRELTQQFVSELQELARRMAG